MIETQVVKLSTVHGVIHKQGWQKSRKEVYEMSILFKNCKRWHKGECSKGQLWREVRSKSLKTCQRSFWTFFMWKRGGRRRKLTLLDQINVGYNSKWKNILFRILMPNFHVTFVIHYTYGWNHMCSFFFYMYKKTLKLVYLGIERRIDGIARWKECLIFELLTQFSKGIRVLYHDFCNKD